MHTITNEEALNAGLAQANAKIRQLNDHKIGLLMESLGLGKNQLPENYLNWETILIIAPSRKVAHELRPYKFAIDRIAIATNINAKKIHVFNLEDWKIAFRNKTQLQIRNLLKTSFGGERKTTESFRKER